MIFEHQGHMIVYDMKKSNRQSIELQLKPGAQLLIKGPKAMTQDQCEKVILKKWDWLMVHIEKMKVDLEGLKERKYDEKESFTILGKEVELRIYKQDIVSAKIQKLPLEWVIAVPENWDQEKIMAYLMVELKRTLKGHIKERVVYYQDQFSKKVNQITIRNQSTKWGSCSSKGNLNFNYRLVFAPLEVIDYLVVHEMSHLEHMNHSKSYWKKVYEVMHDYKDKELWLKKYGPTLSLRYKL